MNESATKKVAAIVTEYRYNSHADVILGRLLGDFGYQPRVEVVSIYTDQVPENDMSREAAARLNIPICPTIGDTVRAAHAGGPVDGIIIIGEHGSYPTNGKGQTEYPRRRFLEETIAALDELGLAVPIFSDKHLAYDYDDARWMYEHMKARGIPFMGGSSIPHTEHVPAFDPRELSELSEILVISSGGLESYGFHAMEVLQSLAEHRNGGESGVRAIYLIDGSGGEAWAAMDRGEWPEDLLLEALGAIPGLPAVHPRDLEPEPALFVVEYMDGTKGYIIQFKRLVEQWSFAFRHGTDRQVTAALCDSDLDRPFAHFERLTRMIESFIETREQPFPMERTLLTTGMICFAMDALFYGRKLETPALQIVYG
ncbi:hypothetical protein [Paenibacillus spongiae]|uniref:DUF1611 domain-containing protein n=1 Tax=Paenibacillus spongiae TaxID=2909671 RepID=A0ABY5S0C6_9BACL|nr:hypothetical protein [Paenibacillus spongiae]UVI27294.1 hypothetical protein L1F29_17585 [Paenibacillus spongiae]